MATGGSGRVVLTALAGNLAISGVKFAAWSWSGSVAMWTEGIHSLVDSGNQVLLLVGQTRARKPPDRVHPFGHGMETYFWSFIVALMIFLVGGAVSIWEGVDKVLHPKALEGPLISFGVLAVCAVFEGLSFRAAYREFRTVVRGRPVQLYDFLKLSKDPSLFATRLEDGAALRGVEPARLVDFKSLHLGPHSIIVVVALAIPPGLTFCGGRAHALCPGRAREGRGRAHRRGALPSMRKLVASVL